MNDRATLKSIARDLGISHMTVSRALSGHPNVTAETRAAVLARAEAVGYVKSAAARAMRGDITGIVGLVLPNLVNEFYAVFADTLARHCQAQGMQLIIHLTRDALSAERQALRQLREVQASAVIMVPSPGALTPEQGGLRVLQLIRQRDGSAAVLADDAGAIGAAVAHLVARGHQHIGFIGADAALSSGQGRLAAFQAALQQHRLPPDPGLTLTGAPTFQMGQDNALALLDGRQPVSAIVCGGFEISNGALDTCLRRGLSLPEDLAFVGYGDPAAYRWIAGGITTLALPVEAMAEGAMAWLAGSGASASFAARLVLRISA